MENAVQALKMAFAVLVFVMALSFTVYVFTQARTASDSILYSIDETNNYEYTNLNNILGRENRIVGLENIIPTLYKYYKENYTVVFKQANYTNVNGEMVLDTSSLEPLFVYETTIPMTSHGKGYENTGALNWGDYNWSKYGIQDDDRYKICAFDSDDEQKRKEPWMTGDVSDQTKINIDAFLSGGVYTSTTGVTTRNIYYSGSNSMSLNRNGNKSTVGFVEQYKNEQFIEYLGEYAYKTNSTGTNADNYEDEEFESTIVVDGEVINQNTVRKKRIITYVLVK